MTWLEYRGKLLVAVTWKEFEDEGIHLTRQNAKEFAKLAGWRLRGMYNDGVVFEARRNPEREFKTAVRRWYRYAWWK